MVSWQSEVTQQVTILTVSNFHSQLVRAKFPNKLKIKRLKDDNFNPTCRTCVMLNLQRKNSMSQSEHVSRAGAENGVERAQNSDEWEQDVKK